MNVYDPFGVGEGQVLPANTTTERYTGKWHKRLDTTSGLISMGVRPYDTVLGRFLAVDPIEGGSANGYDYTNQDPLNSTDLTGEQPLLYDTAGCRSSTKKITPLGANWNVYWYVPVRTCPGMQGPALPSCNNFRLPGVPGYEHCPKIRRRANWWSRHKDAIFEFVQGCASGAFGVGTSFQGAPDLILARGAARIAIKAVPGGVLLGCALGAANGLP